MGEVEPTNRSETYEGGQRKPGAEGPAESRGDSRIMCSSPGDKDYHGGERGRSVGARNRAGEMGDRGEPGPKRPGKPRASVEHGSRSPERRREHGR